MKLNIILSCLLFVCLISLSSAYAQHTQNTSYTLIVTSNNATECNLSYIQYPDDTITIFDLALTKNGNSFYITIDSGNYTMQGDLCHGIVCTDGATIESGTDCQTITPDGVTPSTAQGIAYSFLLVVALVLMIVCFVSAFLIDGKHEWSMGGELLKVNFNNYFKMGLFFLGYLFAIVCSYLAWNVADKFLMIKLGASIFLTIFNILWILLFPIILLIIILGFVKWLGDLELHKLQERGLHKR